MDASENLKREARDGLIDPERLIDLIVELQKARERIAELEQKIRNSSTVKTDQPYSMRAEKPRQQQRGKKGKKKTPRGRRGPIGTAETVALAERTEAVFPAGLPENARGLSPVRPVWRLENTRAV